MGDTNKPRRSRKILLPFLALPFCAMLFYAFGGGKGADDQQEQLPAGLNGTLPGAQFEDQSGRLSPDKLSLYNQVEQDSADRRSQENRDAYSIFNLHTDEDSVQETQRPGMVTSPFSSQEQDQGADLAHQQAEGKIEKLDSRLQKIQAAIDDAEKDTAPSSLQQDREPQEQSSLELEKLEALMASMGDQQGENAELMKMDGMIDKLLDVQHPDRVRNRLKEASKNNKGQVYPVHVLPQAASRQYFGADSIYRGDTVVPVSASKGDEAFFYGNDKAGDGELPTENEGIQAVVHRSQIVSSNASIRFRLQQPIYVAGHFIPKGAQIYGECNLNGERLAVTITSIRYGNLQLPVRLTVYDYDGYPGIRINGSMNRDASKEASDQAIQSVALSSIDPSIGAQAAAAGIESAKRLLSKKVTLVKVTVKSEYPVLLKSDNN
ncbi:conjugative transposon protein TraM [Chitinophaga arvensicola]|uniref:Bacteroides conjugative transposon TraM protein n=1 Tax=Chitinophaga arvensicola TaxID=29529 RepID=A0A1I0PN20_9BACT|nr:conjugative transposon protein TraM [Chitinophaga arvensicola]SEW15790.1 Bacteroides conjugative transposon TraM protein [Chitinophaga arvensicola]